MILDLAIMQNSDSKIYNKIECLIFNIFIMEIPNIVGAGLIVIGAALGIGRIGGSAMDAIARQPEASGKIQTAMLIAAALIEGIGFAALFASQLKPKKTIVATVGCNYCFKIKTFKLPGGNFKKDII